MFDGIDVLRLCRPRETGAADVCLANEGLDTPQATASVSGQIQACITTYAEVFAQLVTELLRVHAFSLGGILDLQSMLVRSRHEMDSAVRIAKLRVTRKYVRYD